MKTLNPNTQSLSSPNRPRRYSNRSGDTFSGYPWYQSLWLSLQGHFRPLEEPQGGYAQFATDWSVPVDFAKITQYHHEPIITWLGHVSMLLQVNQMNILLDPTLAAYAGPWPEGRIGVRRGVPAPLTPEQLPRIDVVLISHNHYDHLCYSTLKRLVDFIAIPIGAYMPRDSMKNVHVNPEEAVRIMQDLEAKQGMAVHWGTFLMAQEAFDHPPRDLALALQQQQLAEDRVWLMRHGETRDIKRQ